MLFLILPDILTNQNKNMAVDRSAFIIGNKAYLFPFMDDTDLEELGDGYASASEMKYCGARYIFNQKIDITQIEQIEIIKYKISR